MHLQDKKDWTNVLHEHVLMSLAQSNAAVLLLMQGIHVSKDTGLPTGICSQSPFLQDPGQPV